MTYRSGYRLMTALAATLLLAACAMGETQAPKAPVVTFVPVTHDVYYPQHTVIVSNKEEAELRAFLAGSSHNPGGNIALTAARPESPQTAERLDDLQRQLKEWGYPQVVVIADATVPDALIRVTSSEASVTAPECPDWSYGHMANYRNTTLSNFGCAQATNLTRMVEDPNDLVAGSGDSGADAERSTGVLETYRTPVDAPQPAGSQTGGM